MNLVAEQFAFLTDVAKLIEFCYNRNVMITGGELYRTQEQQDLYLLNGKTHAKTSNHMRRLAVDFNFVIDGKLTYDKDDLKSYGDFWESLNPLNRWGGNFETITDTDHFESNV
jgi:hypothetical protein